MERKSHFSIFFNSSPLDISRASRSLTYLKGNVFANVKIRIKQNGCPATVEAEECVCVVVPRALVC